MSSTGSAGSAGSAGTTGGSKETDASRSSGRSSSHLAIESLVCFVVSGKSYALDVALVREVVDVGTVFPVPNTPAPVAGVFSLRGATVALVDTSRLLGMPPTGEHGTALVIVRNHETMCALTIDRVVGVTRFIPSHFIPADPERESPEVAGFMPADRNLLTVLEPTVIMKALNRLRFR